MTHQKVFAAAIERTIGEVIAMFDEARLECESAGNVRDECKWKGEMIAYANVVSILEKMKGAGRTGRSIEKKASREAMIERERGKKITTMERRDTARPIV